MAEGHRCTIRPRAHVKPDRNALSIEGPGDRIGCARNSCFSYLVLYLRRQRDHCSSLRPRSILRFLYLAHGITSCDQMAPAAVQIWCKELQTSVYSKGQCSCQPSSGCPSIQMGSSNPMPSMKPNTLTISVRLNIFVSTSNTIVPLSRRDFAISSPVSF